MIYLCRHGETHFNRQGRIQGRRESELTERGRRQAAAMGDLLQRLTGGGAEGPWRVIASPQGRARASAALIAARLGLDVELDERLVEIGLGEWEGRLRQDLARDFAPLYPEREWLLHAPGGEPYEDVMARVTSWLGEQAGEAERRLIVVSHGVAGRLLRGAYAGLSREAIVRQDVPQNAFYRLSEGRLERLDCDPVD